MGEPLSEPLVIYSRPSLLTGSRGGAGEVTPQSGPCRGQWGGASGAKRGSGLTLQQLRVAPVFPAVLLTRTSRGAPSAAPDSTEGPCGGQREAGGGRRKPAWGALGGPERKETQDPGAKRALSAVETVSGHGLALPRNPEGEGEGGRRARKTRPWDRTTGSSKVQGVQRSRALNPNEESRDSKRNRTQRLRALPIPGRREAQGE